MGLIGLIYLLNFWCEAHHKVYQVSLDWWALFFECPLLWPKLAAASQGDLTVQLFCLFSVAKFWIDIFWPFAKWSLIKWTGRWSIDQSCACLLKSESRYVKIPALIIIPCFGFGIQNWQYTFHNARTAAEGSCNPSLCYLLPMAFHIN